MRLNSTIGSFIGVFCGKTFPLVCICKLYWAFVFSNWNLNHDVPIYCICTIFLWSDYWFLIFVGISNVCLTIGCWRAYRPFSNTLTDPAVSVSNDLIKRWLSKLMSLSGQWLTKSIRQTQSETENKLEKQWRGMWVEEMRPIWEVPSWNNVGIMTSLLGGHLKVVKKNQLQVYSRHLNYHSLLTRLLNFTLDHKGTCAQCGVHK